MVDLELSRCSKILQEIFDTYDENKDGLITLDDIEEFLGDDDL